MYIREYMGEVDKRGRLEEEPLSYCITKNNKIMIYWQGKQVKILKGKESDKFIAGIEAAVGIEKQLIMAKVTGNFKRGNEKNAGI
jgi:hypothetical protein